VILEAGQPRVCLAPARGTTGEADKHLGVTDWGPSPGSRYQLQVRIAPRACGFSYPRDYYFSLKARIRSRWAASSRE
jgi:hypothetical protein